MKGIDSKILQAENIDLSGEDLHRIVDGKARIIKYDDLKHFNSINEVLGEHGAVIILYETRENFGHWVCLFKIGNKKLEFFDPYGLKLDEELKVSPEFNMREHGGELVAHLTALIELCDDCEVVSNTTQLQKVLKHTNTCGRWVGMRLRFREVSLREFIALMTENKHYDGDFWVSALTLLV
jgi:hypothetical protein